MKTSKLRITLIGAICFIILTSETTKILDSNGKLGNAGGPGESTCSSAGCHGSGNGSSSSGGLVDNAGTGSITLTSIPAISSNVYIPNQVYQITITVAETGKSKFGFSCEFLDNSENINPSVNNSFGLVTIANTLTTRKVQPFGTGRVYATHQTNGGAFANSATFTFNWTAPASGIVNIYYDGTAVNNDVLSNAADNVYAHSIQLNLAPTSIKENTKINNIKFVQNPAKNNLNFSFNVEDDLNIETKIVDISSKIMIAGFSKNYIAGKQQESIDISNLQNGLYFLIIKGVGFIKTEKIIVAN